MKKLKFLWLLLPLALAGALGIYTTSCQPADEQELTMVNDQEINELNNSTDAYNGEATVTSRTVCSGSECEFTATALDDNTTLFFCGDAAAFTNECQFGCNTLSDDRSESATLDTNERKTFCVSQSGSISIRNDSGGTRQVSFYFGTSTPVTVTMANNQVVRYHTNSSCATLNDCL